MILDKAKMAHDYAIEMLKRGDPERSIAFDAWTLADAMQAEADKRVVKLPHVFFDTNKNEEWQPDWSQAPEWASYFAMDEDGEFYYFEQSPSMASCSWQPQSPGESCETLNHSYNGNWQDSLRKRPQ